MSERSWKSGYGLQLEFRQALARFPMETVEGWRKDFEAAARKRWPGLVEESCWDPKKRDYPGFGPLGLAWAIAAEMKMEEIGHLEGDLGIPVLTDVHGHAEKKPDTTPALLKP